MPQTLLDTSSSSTNGAGAIPVPSSLAEIQVPVKEDLRKFREYFRSAMRTDVKLLDRVVRYVLRQKGKQLRPTLVLLSAQACGEIEERTYRGAALVELLHSATLIHDDVVDEADKRRGLFSINALWKNKVAVLFGDFLLSRGLLLALKFNDYELLQTMSDAVRRMAEGELLQIEKARRLDIDEDVYFRIISDKTASLISACTVSGAVSVGATPETVEAMRTFGEKLGLAFQIRDDLFDFGGTRTGKPTGVDLKEKKMTLPVIHAMSRADRSERRKIVSIFRRDRKSAAELALVTDFVRRLGGIEYALSTMRRLADEARAVVDELPPSDARQSLIGLIEFTVNRSR
jgi:octaprenyl-diphosphate synthase